MTRNVRVKGIGRPQHQWRGGSRSGSRTRGMHFIAEATQVDAKRWTVRLKPDECKPVVHSVPRAVMTVSNHGPGKINLTTASGMSVVQIQTPMAPGDIKVIAIRDYVFVETLDGKPAAFDFELLLEPHSASVSNNGAGPGESSNARP